MIPWSSALLGLPADLLLWGLLDGAALPDAFSVIRALRVPWLSLAPEAATDQTKAASPFLLPLAEGSAARAWLLSRDAARGEATPILVPPEVTADALRAQCETIRLADVPLAGALRLRFADPRVLGELVPLLSPAQAARLFGPIRALFAVAGVEQPRIVRLDAPPPGTIPAPGRLAFDPAQIAALNAAAERRFVLRLADHLRNRLPRATGEMGRAAVIARIRAALPRAAARGVITERGLAAWMALDLIYGPQFGDIPEFAGVLNAWTIATPDERIEALLARLRETENA